MSTPAIDVEYNYLVIATSRDDDVGMSFCGCDEKVERWFDVLSVLLNHAFQVSTALRYVASQTSAQSEMSEK